jgi:hypothetical protein
MSQRERHRGDGGLRPPAPDPEALAAALLESTIGRELAQAFAQDLSHTLLRGFHRWCTANLHKTQSPHEVFVGLGLFIQDVIATLWLATTTDEAGKARYLALT